MITSPQPLPPLALIVDDDATFRMLSRMSLEQDDLRVEDVSSGEAAIEFVSSTMPDIIILDLQMPGMNGFAVCEQIRRLPNGTFVPILIMTGLDDVDSIAQAYEMGATDFIVKPCHGLMLSQRVRYMLRASHTMSALRTRESQLAQAQRIARLGGWEWDPAGDQMDLSEAACGILGIQPAAIALSHSTYLACVHDEDRELVTQALYRTLADGTGVDMDHRLMPRDGVNRVVHLLGEVMTNSGTQARWLIGTVQDVTDARAAEARIYFMANYDSLTHLPNRTLFLHRVGQVLTSGTGSHSAVLVISLDRDHRICDLHGSQRRDYLIRETAVRLQHSLSEDITVTHPPGVAPPILARLSDGQFALFLTNLAAPEDSARVAQNCLDALRNPFQIESTSVALSADIGIAIPGSDGTEAEQILRNAGTAAQSVTRKGSNGYQFYSNTMNVSIATRVSLEQDLRAAVSENQFILHYQPQVEILSEKVIGFEALIRWQHPTRGLISPAEFISVAEEEELIIKMSEWVIKSVAQQQRIWHKNGLGPTTVSINLSGLHFRQPNLASQVKSLVYAEGGNPRDIELELTESVLMRDASSTTTLLQELKASGFRLAIDDFGTGYSSLAYLEQFPIDTLKIDQAFIKDLKLGKEDSPITRAIVGMGRALKLHVVAEGVETRDQLAYLRLQGCDAYQGYLFSKPMPVHQLQYLLQERFSAETSRTKDRSRTRLAN
ncbi:MAG: EAL domain-containing protein [Nitrospira sp.]|nr:EAL domain-containing protein [Nitrospira sp.]